VGELFTLHALWPFLWIWAMLYQRGWGFAHGSASEAEAANKMDELLRRVQELEARADLPKKTEWIEARRKHSELSVSADRLDPIAKRGAKYK
jgi:hypothetical protein